MKVPSAHLSKLPLKASRWTWNETRGCASAFIGESAVRRNSTPKPRTVLAIIRVRFMVSFPANSVAGPGARFVGLHLGPILHTQGNSWERDKESSASLEQPKREGTKPES